MENSRDFGNKIILSLVTPPLPPKSSAASENWTHPWIDFDEFTTRSNATERSIKNNKIAGFTGSVDLELCRHGSSKTQIWLKGDKTHHGNFFRQVWIDFGWVTTSRNTTERSIKKAGSPALLVVYYILSVALRCHKYFSTRNSVISCQQKKPEVNRSTQQKV